MDGLSEFGARGDFDLKPRAFAWCRLHPDAPAVHFHDLLGDGETEAGAALGLGKGTVDLVELIEVFLSWHGCVQIFHKCTLYR